AVDPAAPAVAPDPACPDPPPLVPPGGGLPPAAPACAPPPPPAPPGTEAEGRHAEPSPNAQIMTMADARVLLTMTSGGRPAAELVHHPSRRVGDKIVERQPRGRHRGPGEGRDIQCLARRDDGDDVRRR